MKQLELKTTEIKKGKDEEGALTTYDDLVKAVVNHKPQGGFNPEEMRHRMRILDALGKADDAVLILEDADANKLRSCAIEMRWPFMHVGLLEFTDDVLAMPEYKNGEDA